MKTMKRVVILAAAASICLIAPLGTAATSVDDAYAPPAFAPDRVLVAFKPGTPAAAKRAAHGEAGGSVIKALEAIGVDLVSVPINSVQGRIAVYKRNPNVRYVEPDYLRTLILPDEGVELPPPNGLGIDYFAEQWGLNNTGQPFYYDEAGAPGALTGTLDADIDAPEAWDISQGSPGIKIAILDSGVECTHPDLIGKCVEQLNFGPSSSPDDIYGHGTHVAGIAAAMSNNDLGVAGVSWGSLLGSLKVCYEYPSETFPLYALCTSEASAAAMIYAADNGYKVINMSYGGPEGSQAEQDAAAYAQSKGVVMVAAAGNDYLPALTYPAAFPEVMAVAASDRYDNIANFSNFGPWVSVAAPGVRTFSTYLQAGCGDPSDGCFAWLSGTSMASPHVAGAAAVVWAHLGSGATSDAVRQAIENNADTSGALGQNWLAWTSFGRLNLHQALLGGGTPPPPPPPPPTSGMHVSAINMSLKAAGPNVNAIATVTVVDAGGAAVEGATVFGQWSGLTGDSDSGLTDGSGQVSLSSNKKKNASGTFTFTVTDVTKVGSDYVPSAVTSGSIPAP